ncbi:caspase-8 [Tautogolabrus adspersus]
MMDRLKLSHIDEELDSSEVAALCFLCRNVISRKRLEKVRDAKDLFLKLEESGLMENGAFLSQLLNTIRRADLLSLLETDSRRPEETDANPLLSAYSVMLYNIHQNMTDMNFEKMKFQLTGRLDKRQIESCKTPLDVFIEMEKTGLLSNQNLDELHTVVKEFDQQLATTVQLYKQGIVLQAEYYALTHNPRGQCVVINNELFKGSLGKRGGSEKDEGLYHCHQPAALRSLFTQLGFTVVVHHNLTADDMQLKVRTLSQRDFREEDALVICVLSHGEKGSVYGSDGQEVYIRELTLPFTSEKAPTLAGKPKLFFIQACQGKRYQGGAVPLPPRPRQEGGDRQSRLEEDAGPVPEETVPWDADFLLGMATVPECKSFRNTSTGSIYIQELCRQLKSSAESSQMDSILSVLTRVNREVSKGVFLNNKQMPEPKYTLTKQLVLKYV